MAEPRSQSPDLSMDTASLYREETFTDRKIGTIQKLTPVDGAGATDNTRAILFMGQTQLMTPAGPLPINFEIEADSLEQAANAFAEGATHAAEETMQRLNEMRRESASSIVTPGQGGLGGAGAPGGGIQMP